MQSKTPAIQLLCIPLAILSGFALAYAMPSHNVWLLGWVALTPLLIASRIMKPVYAAGLGMICAFVSGAILAGSWATVYQQIGNLFAAFAGVGLVLAFACGAASCGRRMSAPKWVLLVACAGVTAEYLSRFAFPVALAISQHENAAALRIASWTGIWGVGFLLWLAQASVAMIFWKPKAGLVALASVALVMSAARYAPQAALPTKTIRAAAIQSPDQWGAKDLTERLRGVDVAVWPEHLMTATQFPRAAARKSGSCVLASVSEKSPGGKNYNAAWLIAPNGRRVAYAHKQHLFGREQFTFRRGERSSPVECDGFRPGLAICCDTEFTDVVRGLAVRGAEIVLVPNHDPESAEFLFNYLHSAVIPFRAAENGVPVVWSEGYGLSMLVDGRGKVLSQARPGDRTAVVANVPLREGTTLFTRIGDAFAYLCIATLVVLPLIGRNKSRVKVTRDNTTGSSVS